MNNQTMTETILKTPLITDIKNGSISAIFADWLENNAAATTFTQSEIQQIIKNKTKKAIFVTIVLTIFVIVLLLIGVSLGEIIVVVFALLIGIIDVFTTKHTLKEKNAIKSDFENEKYAAYIVTVDEKLAFYDNSEDGHSSSSFYIRCGEAEIKEISFNSVKKLLTQYKTMNNNTRRGITGSGNDSLLQMRRLSEPYYMPNGFIIEIEHELYKNICDKVFTVVFYGSDKKIVHFFEYKQSEI